MFSHEIGLFELFTDAHPLECAEAARQKGLADFEPRKFFFLQNRNVPPLLCQQCPGSGSCRPASGDQYIEEFCHNSVYRSVIMNHSFDACDREFVGSFLYADLIIFACSKWQGVELFNRDNHFDALAKVA